MTTINKIFVLTSIIISGACSNDIIIFQDNAVGMYNLLDSTGAVITPIQQFSIDDTGNMSDDVDGVSPLDLLFDQGISDSEAIYRMVAEPHHFVPIKIITNIIYSNASQASKQNVSFSQMTAFGKKTSSQ